MSYGKALVPLDGSELAECALPYVQNMAKSGFVDEIELARVIHPVEVHFTGGVPISREEEDELTGRAKSVARSYLASVAKKLKDEGGKVSTKVLVGSVAEALDDYIKTSKADMVVMCTHGRSGPSRWVWGSIADKLLRSVCVPIFLIHAPHCGMEHREN